MITVYVFLDSNNFISGWSSTEEPNSTQVKLEEKQLKQWERYKLINGKLLYDEANIFEKVKKRKVAEVTKLSKVRIENGFDISLEGEPYRFPLNEASKSSLQKSYGLVGDSLITEATHSLINVKNGLEEIKTLQAANINELWLLSFLYEEEVSKQLAKAIETINSKKTVDELLSTQFI